MASKAATHRVEHGGGGQPAAAPRITHWWQLFMLYPAAAGALLTAIPNWVDRAQALYHGASNGSFASSERQQALWAKNISCLEQPPAWHSNPSHVRVNATVCRSGDVLVRVSTPDEQVHFEWVELDRILRPAGAGFSLIPEAQAASLTAGFGTMQPAPAQSGGARLYRALYQPAEAVVCQRFLDQRRLLRHIRTPRGCFDEVIDTLNGAVVQRTQVPCRGGC